MDDTARKELINTNYRILFLLGIATAIIAECREERPNSERGKFDWFMDAVNEVVYKDNPLPPFPIV